jgi:hypothetical protein
MYNESFCRAGGFECDKHRIARSSGEPWECCSATASHVFTYEVCPVPSKAVPLKTKEELAATANQQLKAEIAALVESYVPTSGGCYRQICTDDFLSKLRQLSAI